MYNVVSVQNMIKLEQILWCMSRASLNKITTCRDQKKSNAFRNINCRLEFINQEGL